MKCDHCLLQFPEREAVYDDVKGREKVFCCHGCKGIYRLINDEGLTEFYRKRDSWTPGPAETGQVDTAAFTDNLKPVGKEIETDLVLDGIRCASCVWLNEKILLRTKGVTYANVNYATHRARIRWDPEETGLDTILSRISSIGYTPKPFASKSYEEDLKNRQRDLLLRFGTASFFSMQLMLYSIALYAGYFQGIETGTKLLFEIISLFLATPVLFYSGWPMIRGSVKSINNLSFNMDVLITAGAGAAYFYSIYQITQGGEVYFDTAAMIITLILLGRYIEAGAKKKASQTLTHLLSLSPKEARIVKRQRARGKGQELMNTDTVMVPIASVKTGELIQVVPGEKIPLDGVVVEGSSEIDESMLTGESRPVVKTQGSEVFCGTQNLFGSFIFEVKRTGADTMLSQIIKTVEDAQAKRAPVQAFADRVVGFFVPAVLLLGVMTFIYWSLRGIPTAGAVMNSVSVMVIACPCALGLATPLAILIGTTRGASKGILIKGGDVIEKSKDIDTVILDKTGTLTEGKPVLSSFSGTGMPDLDALRFAASLERLSGHSIGKAIVDAAKGLELYDVENFSAYPGRGVKGGIDGNNALVGSENFLEAEGVVLNIDTEMLSRVESSRAGGATVVYLSYDNRLAGVFFVSDVIRKEAGNVVRELLLRKVAVAMITGDNINTAASIAKEAGIDWIRAEMSPVEKAGEIKRMQEEGRHVIMVGDGINDAPALVQADVGIAMGRGADIALESSDMVLMRNDLGLLPEAVSLSKKTFSVIRQNIFWALFYNVIAIPLAVSGILHPVIAAAAMAFSSLSVVGNSLRLRRC
ncbi:MAG: heavy metal translocating P-type ATPase [Nitrospiraceae bacterium]|nr:MAG: heavy metal translocating P-type ATPase [Nitrospiraceae bacterium]